MNKPEAGSAVAVTIINSNGTPETFKLALARAILQAIGIMVLGRNKG